MDNLKKVLTNRTELAGNLYKYTNVVKGNLKYFVLQFIVLSLFGAESNVLVII